ncbi:MAG TPA: 16S rRNA (cytidine(1402)-2'-O)-methyltransferase [Candidatus Coprenecus pullistercoris]|nr:16S rRNA (cytidine(1402)-2'-O)-methyltransferase [Candidatus Coprenecus pullistercoris]
MAGRLYIVPTPVGNLGDMTLRALDVLKQVDLILAEDTRTTSVLLKHYGISKPTEAHHKFNEHARVRPVCEKLLSGMDIALVSDAGTPGISDPGFMLARECAAEDIEVITLPGPTAFVPALIDSGLPADRFAFEGFLPVKKGRQTRLTELASECRTMIFYESPYRLAKTLAQMCGFFGEGRRASVSREISKVHEETRRGTLAELASWYTDNPPKGEIVLIVEGKDYVGRREKEERED